MMSKIIENNIFICKTKGTFIKLNLARNNAYKYTQTRHQ